MSSFAAAVGDWAAAIEGAIEAIFRESVQDLVSELTALVPVDVGILRASLVASTAAMPELNRPHPNPGGAKNSIQFDRGPIELVILGTDVGDTIYLGYTANYGAYVHYGSNGRPGRPWVDMVAQRWPQIVAARAAEVKARLGI